MTDEQEKTIRDIVGMIKKLNGGSLPENFDFRLEVRRKRFNQMRITDVGEEKNLIKKFRLRI
ncbi:MAG: hypothetical protein A2Y94_04355 [Caldithrix sp. RBG_13_44_9]|nr:MAG: hypothetical protein A2Y94_04355 [Caldithrix sp. RBG_13_44_9]